MVPAEVSTYDYYTSYKFHFYGEEMMRHMMAFRTLIGAGIVPTAGSDFSPGPFSPLMAIQGMVTRTGWNGETWGANQRISLDEAFRETSDSGESQIVEGRDIKPHFLCTGWPSSTAVDARDHHRSGSDECSNSIPVD